MCVMKRASICLLLQSSHTDIDVYISISVITEGTEKAQTHITARVLLPGSSISQIGTHNELMSVTLPTILTCGDDYQMYKM